LAPSPTGALHLGNLRTFIFNYALARQQDWRIVLRIEDLDGPRVKAHAIDETIDILRWVGFDWDEGPVFQSHDQTPYRMALVQLASSGLIYPCRCTRKQVLAASLSAPHAEDQEPRYPGTCRPARETSFTGRDLDDLECGWRFCVPDRQIVVRDQFAGEHAWNVHCTVGDFLVATKGGIPSYQLAVVVDDARQSVDRIVRGDDLLSSVPRQHLLYDALNLRPYPEYWHVPLVRGTDGRRLAKRHGDTRVARYRDQGVSPDRLIALMARWCGITDEIERMTLTEFVDRFDMAQVPRSAIEFSARDHSWLLDPA
jgi:glutamyl-tRNA synthetase